MYQFKPNNSKSILLGQKYENYNDYSYHVGRIN